MNIEETEAVDTMAVLKLLNHYRNSTVTFENGDTVREPSGFPGTDPGNSASGAVQAEAGHIGRHIDVWA